MTHPTDDVFAIEAQSIARRFGARWILRGVSLHVRPGEVVGLLGSNGCGKSTLLRMLATLLKPTAGSAAIYGHDVVTEADEVRRNIGFLAHTPGLYDDLSARENLEFAAEMLGGGHEDIDALIERVNLSHVRHERVRGFSAGMQRRLALGRLMLTKARVLLFDEPYSNLDTDGIRLMNSIISEAARDGGAALVVLHELAPAAGLLDRTVTIRDGRVADPTAALLAEAELASTASTAGAASTASAASISVVA
jgi:heme exporter protein A